MVRIFSFAACIYLFVSFVHADTIQKYSFSLPANMDRADVYAIETVPRPENILVLCPGCNGNGEGLIKSHVWQKFAIENRLGLMGLSFSSPSKFHTSDSNRGYYHASQGSGQVLLDAVKKVYGHDVPLLLYGVSGGAHFTSRFVEWKPDRVVTGLT